VTLARLGIVVTALMVLFLFGGSNMTLVGLAELTCAGAWLFYLLNAHIGRDRSNLTVAQGRGTGPGIFEPFADGHVSSAELTLHP
jgi:hypothetical protein